MDDARHTLPSPQTNWALFLDIDGTLLDIAPTPDAVVVPDGLGGLLDTLNRTLGGAVALVSGRSIAAIDTLFAPLKLSAAGQHGAEIRIGQDMMETVGTANGSLSGLLPPIEAFAKALPGVLVEYKGMTVAVHFRAAPEHEAALEQFLNESIAGRQAWLEIMHGHKVFEVKPRGISKGTAVERFMRTDTFAGRIPIFLGDDRTDEDGFAAAQAMGGYGIKVGQAKVGQADESAAGYRLMKPEDVRVWLTACADGLQTRSAR